MNKLTIESDETKIEMNINSCDQSELDDWIDSMVRGLEAITYQKESIIRAMKEYEEQSRKDNEDK